MPITLTITDNSDGTGGVATIAGAGSGETVTLYRASFDGTQQAYPFSSAGTRTGNGTIAVVTLGTAIWQATATNSGSLEVSPVVIRSLTNATTQSVSDRILTAVEQRIKLLALTGISSTRVVEKWQPRHIPNLDSLPSVYISNTDGESYPNQMTNTDDVSYPVLVVLVDQLNQEVRLNRQRNRLWRQRIARAFRYQRLPGVAEVFNCIPRPRALLDPNAYDKNYFVSAHIFEFIAREPRGLS